MLNPDDVRGKHLLVGLTYVDSDGNVTRQLQLHGTITRIDDQGISFDQANGQGEFSLPPDLNFLRPAAPASTASGPLAK